MNESECGAIIQTRTKQFIKNLDPLLASTAIGIASLMPGPGGVAIAAGGMTFDAFQGYWLSAMLSALSMIPLIGYLPAGFKVARNVALLDRRLSEVEALLPEIRRYPELLGSLQVVVGKYESRLVRVPLATPLIARLTKIMEATPLIQT